MELIQKDLKCLELDEIKVSTVPSADLFQAKKEAILLSLTMEVSIVMVHQNSRYIVKYGELIKTIRKVD